MESSDIQKNCRKRPHNPSEESDDYEIVNTVVTQEYGVVRTIFKHLTLHDLKNTACVCRNWQKIAEIERSHRTGCPAWFAFRSSESFPRWDTFVKNFWYKPRVCVTFSTASLTIKQEVYEKVRKDIKNLGCMHLTVGCTYLLRSIVFNELVVVDHWYPVEYAFLLPDFPGAKIVPFRLTADNYKKLYRGEIPSCLAKPGMPVKSLLLFCTRTTYYGANLALRLQARQTEGIAIGGAVVQNVKYYNKTEAVIGLAFYGDNVVASSLVLHKSLDDVEDVIMKFRQQVVDGEHNIAFMFACRNRCNQAVNMNNIIDITKRYSKEGTLFRKYFPMRHFLGILGDGEIGTTCVPVPLAASVGDKSKPKFTEKPSNLRHAFSVVVVHIAINVPPHLRLKQERRNLHNYARE